MIFSKKGLFFALLISITVTFAFSNDLPSGYRDINLGMTLEETKSALLKDPAFGYHGERDVSLIPGGNKTLIETDSEYGYGSTFLKRCYFQFYDDTLYIITINVNQDKMDYYSIFTTLSKKYGNPQKLNPQSATWKNDKITLSLEKPLTLKYILNDTFEQTQKYSDIEKSPEEMTSEMFLDEL